VSKNVSPTVLNRTEHWIEKISIASSSVDIKVTLGDTDDARSLISDSEMTEIKPEGYRIKAHCAEGASPLIAIRGNPREHAGPNYPIGVNFGVYRLLSELGVHFLHPLDPTLTPEMDLDEAALCSLDISSAPQWETRIWHYHSMHPLDLHEVLNGFDSAFSNQTWSSMLPEVFIDPITLWLGLGLVLGLVLLQMLQSMKFLSLF